MSEESFTIRDRRTEKQFFVDNTIVLDYGRIIGVYGIAVYAALCARANSFKMNCWPSLETIALDIGCSRRKVVDVISTLERVGLIGREKRRDPNGDQDTNMYYLLDPPDVTESAPGAPTNNTEGTRCTQVVQEVPSGSAPGAHEQSESYQ